jgi:hypothetical protein
MEGYGEDEETEDLADDVYDPETDTYKKSDYEDKERNIFFDSEFVVKEVDMTKGVIIGIPYSLKKKNILVEIDPENVDEVFIK